MFPGRAENRVGVLKQCQPTAEQQLSACPSCHRENSWEPEPSIRDISTVFLRSAAVETEFLGFRCTTEDCTGTLQCDGFEQCLLRYSANLAWTMEVLWEFWENVAEKDGQSWRRCLRWLKTYQWCARIHLEGVDLSESALMRCAASDKVLWLLMYVRLRCISHVCWKPFNSYVTRLWLTCHTYS